MKSNQERSNGCLPPKKREILALEQRPVVVAAATPPAVVPAESPHTENLAWLASVATEHCKAREAESPRCPVPSISSSSPSAIPSPVATLPAVPLASLPAVYPATIPQQAGTIQFAQLGPNVQFISSGPYSGYISSHIIPANSTPVPNSTAIGQRHQLDGHTTALVSPSNKVEQHFQIGLPPTELAPGSLPSSPQVTNQYFHLDSRTPLTVSGNTVASPTTHLQLHPHAAVLPQTLTLAPSQLVVQYADGSAGKKPDGHAKGVLNGELEVVKQTKTSCQTANHQPVQSYETRHFLLPADYSQNPTGLQTSLVLLAQPNHGAEHESGSNKISLVQTEKGSICLGKPVSRSSSFTSLSSSEVVKSVAPHAIIQTSVPAEELPASLYSSTQPPIIGYITSTNQHAVSYHAALPQHLVIPSGQSLLIPVTNANNGTEMEVSRTVTALAATTTPQISTAMPHAYLATALSKCEALTPDGNRTPSTPPQAATLLEPPSKPGPAVATVPSQPPTRAPTPPSIQGSPSVSSPPSPATLPPFFMRGSIIQLADGELKRVEDLKTEDFIQSAEISSELKIDSSTVERIDTGQSPNAVLIQFSVGELKAQVCVEVLVEYPFFVFGQGWSSCCPDRTTQLFELSCAKLCVGDVCVSLTLRSLRNGSLADSPSLGAKLKTTHLSETSSSVDLSRNSLNTLSGNGGVMKPSSTDVMEWQQFPGTGSRASLRAALGPHPLQEERTFQPEPVLAVAETGDMRQESVRADMAEPPKLHCADPERPSVRKRRWSAPERDQTERAEEEPPITLPKPSFLPQEIKISIEGRSSAGGERGSDRRVDC